MYVILLHQSNTSHIILSQQVTHLCVIETYLLEECFRRQNHRLLDIGDLNDDISRKFTKPGDCLQNVHTVIRS